MNLSFYIARRYLLGKKSQNAINIISTKPAPEFAANLRARVGEFGEQHLRGMVNFPISDKVFARSSDETVQQAGQEIDPTLKSRLLDCLRKLSKTRLAHARILTLHFQGFSVPEICDRVGISSNNLYVRLSRARKLLANCLENGDVT